MPLVILEGPDGSGKSTLAAKLLKGTGHPTLLVKRSGPPGSIETLEFQAKWIADQARSGLNIIADRHPLISEAIYRPTVRLEGASPWRAEDVGPILAQKKGTLLIFCRPDWETLKRTRHIEKQMDGVIERYRDLVEEYDRWMGVLRSAGARIVTYDFVTDPQYEIAQTVREFWEEKR